MPDLQQSSVTPPVTLLVCARNEAANLRLHLPSLLAQQYAGLWELLVVDDASTDDTAQVLSNFQRSHPDRFRTIFLTDKTRPGKKAALEAGITLARFDWLLLTDADCQPASPLWLAHMAAHFSEKTDIVLGYAPVTRHSPKGGGGPTILHYWSRFETAHTALQYLTLTRLGMPYMGVGRNLAWRKSLFSQTSGFDRHADLASGDDDLFVNAAARPGRVAICLDKEAFVFSESKKTWRAWFRQKRRHLSAGTRYRPLHRAVLGALALAHVLHYALVALLLVSGAAGWAMGLYVLRLAMVLPFYWRGLRKLNEADLWRWLPLLDAGMAVYYGLVVPWALATGPSQSENQDGTDARGFS